MQRVPLIIILLFLVRITASSFTIVHILNHSYFGYYYGCETTRKSDALDHCNHSLKNAYMCMYNTRVCKVAQHLFQAIRSVSQDDDDDDDDDKDYIIYRSQSNSVILSAQIPNVDVSNLTNPIEMRFQQNIKVGHIVVSLVMMVVM